MRRGGVVALLAGAILGCGVYDEITSPIVPVQPQTPTLPPSAAGYGSIAVTTRTSGSDLDPDGYVVRTDGEWDYTATPTPIAVNGTVTLRAIVAGAHTLTLKEVAPNCDGASLNDREVVVVAGAATQVVFEVVCNGVSEPRGEGASTPE